MTTSLKTLLFKVAEAEAAAYVAYDAHAINPTVASKASKAAAYIAYDAAYTTYKAACISF